MDTVISNIAFKNILPEIWVAFMACVVLLAELFLSPKRRLVSFFLAFMTLIGAIALTYELLGSGTYIAFYNSFIQDDVGNFLKLVIYILGLIIFLYSRTYTLEHKMIQGEYYALCLFSILGMMVLISSYSLLTLYLGVELVSLPLYALIALSKDRRAPEASMKYFVMGALASGMMLYGISLLYGVTGTLQIPQIAAALQNSPISNITIVAMVLILIGLAFKLGAVPFHMWVPDVYEGSAASVTLFIGVLPELAGFGMAIRLLMNTFPTLDVHWEPLFIIMAILSLAVGNIVAIAQSNIKRMLAYSSIGHMGFVFLGLLAGPSAGFAAALAYIIIYALTVLGAFGIITALSYRNFEAEHISDFRGLGKTQPWIAFLMLIVMFSLAGVPPTVGFYAKFLVLDALVAAGHTWLAVLGVIFAVIAAYYYLAIVRVMYFDAPTTEFKAPPVQVIKQGEKIVLTVNCLAILLLGIFPAPLINACLNVLKLH